MKPSLSSRCALSEEEQCEVKLLPLRVRGSAQRCPGLCHSLCLQQGSTHCCLGCSALWGCSAAWEKRPQSNCSVLSAPAAEIPAPKSVCSNRPIHPNNTVPWGDPQGSLALPRLLKPFNFSLRTRVLAFVHKCACEQCGWCPVAVHPFRRGSWSSALSPALWPGAEGAVTSGATSPVSAVSLPATLAVQVW